MKLDLEEKITTNIVANGQQVLESKIKDAINELDLGHLEEDIYTYFSNSINEIVKNMLKIDYQDFMDNYIVNHDFFSEIQEVYKG